MPSRILLLTMAALLMRAETLDRIAVSVGRQVITEREVMRDLRVDAFLDQKPVEASADLKRKAADRLVDQLLILEEAALTGVTLSTPEDAGKLLAGVKAQYGADYEAALKRYEIKESDVARHLLAGLRAMRFTDLRFRPEVQISEDDLRDYYGMLVTEWKSRNAATIPTFEASREQVEKLLTDQRTAQALDRWLGARRAETQILYREQVFR